MAIYSDLRSLKVLLEIDQGDTSSDKKLNFLNEAASQLVEELLDRDFVYKSRVRVYDGTGTQKLLLKHRPVYPFPPAGFSQLAVNVDESAYYGEATGAFTTNPDLVYGQDYALKIDQDDGGSRSGILYRIRSLWPKPQFRQTGLLTPFIGHDSGSVRVTYTAGFTVDTLPAAFRHAVELLIARMNQLWPLGAFLNSESYGDTAGSESQSIHQPTRDMLLGLVRPILYSWKNWSF